MQRKREPNPALQPTVCAWGFAGEWLRVFDGTLVNASIFISLVAVMGIVGCASKSPPLVVAYGRLMSQHDDVELRVARYRVSAVQRGRLPTNVVEVVFWRKTQNVELPREAVLLLSRPIAPAVWYAVGGDATRGLLLDTPEARARVASLADRRILDGPRRDWLPRDDAERIIKNYLRAAGVDVAQMRLDMRRGEFGWKASVSFPDPRDRIPVGGKTYIGIRDSGEILYWSK